MKNHFIRTCFFTIFGVTLGIIFFGISLPILLIVSLLKLLQFKNKKLIHN